MHEFIRSISSNLSAPAVSTRAIALFSQAMSSGRYRWGRKAKLAAAASVAVALRESHRSDSLRDIAFLIDEPPLALCRAFISLLDVLKVPLTSSDPATHFPAIRTHLSSLTHSPPTTLSRSLIAFLEPLSLPAATRTAHALSMLISRLGNASLVNLPTAPTACALIILGLEAEARTSVPSLGELAQYLGDRFGAGKGVVMSRYKLLYDLLEEWTREVPWLDHFTSKNGRSKISKRVVVARGLKDVLQFQQDIWQKRLQTTPRLGVTLDMNQDQCEDDNDNNIVSTRERTDENQDSPHKKRKSHHELISASRFLLDPSSTAMTVTPRTSLAMLSFLLTADDPTLSHQNPPTRLQRLAAERGGEREITDEELFEEGEWEIMVRTPGEQEALYDVLTRDIDETIFVAQRERDEGACLNRTKRPHRADVHTSGRINSEAYSTLLRNLEACGSDGFQHLINCDLSSIQDSEDERLFLDEETRRPNDGLLAVGHDEVLESWRPPSPDDCCHDRYNQEY